MKKFFLKNIFRLGREKILMFALILSVFLFYGKTATFSYVRYDDTTFILKNRLIREFSLKNFAALWKPGAVDRELLYIPVTYLSFMLENALSDKNNPVVTHMANVILHTLNTLLVYVFAKNCRISSAGSFLVSSAFALHPLQIEAVAWAMGRKDLLSTAFALASLIFYLRNSQKEKRKFFLWFAAFIFAGLAMLTKPTLMILPVLMMFLEIFYSSNALRLISFKKIFVLLYPFFVLSAAVFWLNGQISGYKATPHSLSYTLMCIPWVIGDFIKKLFYLTPLYRCYPWPGNENIFEFFLPSIFMIAGTLFILSRLVFRLPSGKYILFCILFFSIAYLPALTRIYSFVSSFSTADRYSYFPLIGLFMACGWILNELDGTRRNIFAAVFVLWIGIGMFHGIQVMDSWRDSVSIWEWELKHNQKNENFRSNLDGVHYLLGAAYQEENELKKAEEHYFKCLELNKNYQEAYINLGVIYTETGHFSDAEICFKEALKQKTRFNPQIYLNFAELYLKTGREDEAITSLEKAVELRGDFPEALFRLAEVHLIRKEADKTEIYARKSVECGFKIPSKFCESFEKLKKQP